MTSATFLVTIQLTEDELIALEDIALDIQDELIAEFGESTTVRPWSRPSQQPTSTFPPITPAPPSPYL